MILPLIPYFQTSRYRVATMVDLAEPKPGEKGVDLGSGDGRIVIAFANRGVQMYGFELDTNLLRLSEKNITQANLNSAFIENKNFWDIDLSGFDIITIYPMPDVMVQLEEKLKKEADPGTRILTNYYPLPTWIPSKMKDNIHLYIR